MSKENKGSAFAQDKIFLHGNHLRNYIEKGYTFAPVTMEIDLTNNCNNKCPGCTGYNEDNAHMKTELAERIIKELGETGVRGLIFTGGGEPLLHKDLAYLVGKAKEGGMDVGLITSGQRPAHFKDEHLTSIIENANWLRVSLDAGSERRYRKTHGLKAKEFLKAQRFILDAATTKAFHNPYCTIGVGYLTGLEDKVTEQGDIHNAAVLCGELGADYFQLRPFHDSDRKVDFSDYTKEWFLEKRYETKLLRSAHKYDHMGDKGERNYDYCHGAHFASVITADGSLYLCCHFRNQPLGLVGSLVDTHFAELWNGDDVRKVNEKIDVKKCVPYCRCDNFNRSLEQMTEGYKNEHKNFL